MTASQIADELGGVSRNAVIGKAHRLGLDARPSPVKPGDEKEKKPVVAAPAPQPKPAPRTEAVASRPAAPTSDRAQPAASHGGGPQRQQSSDGMQYRSVGPGGFIRQ